MKDLLIYVGLRRGGSSIPWLLPDLDVGLLLPPRADAGKTGGPMIPLNGRLADLVLLEPAEPGVSRRSNGSSRRGGSSLETKAVWSKRADNGTRMAVSGDREAAESGLRELAVEPELKNEVVDGRASFKEAGRPVEAFDTAVPGLPVISDNCEGGQDGPTPWVGAGVVRRDFWVGVNHRPNSRTWS